MIYNYSIYLDEDWVNCSYRKIEPTHIVDLELTNGLDEHVKYLKYKDELYYITSMKRGRIFKRNNMRIGTRIVQRHDYRDVALCAIGHLIKIKDKLSLFRVW